MAGGSPSSPEPAGFRVERALGEHTWQAVQLDLGRTVALRRLPAGSRVDAACWPQRSGVVDLFAVVDAADGTYVATHFLPGARTLAECRGVRVGRRRRWLAEAAAALDGNVHGRLTERDILVDGHGRAFVTGFGRAPAGATADGDRAALAAMQPEPRRRRPALLVLAPAAVVAAAAVVLTRGDEPAPPIPAGTRAIGSALAPGAVRTLDCEGDAPSGNSPPCTIMQASLRGRVITVPFAGLVHGWAVRGASGLIRLQVLVPRDGGYVVYNSSRPVAVKDPDRPRYVRADRSFPAGARFALEVFPGGAVGIRRAAGGATARFFSALRSEVRRPDLRGGGGQELLLRVDVVRRR